jgi:asparagine synthase (glutamine-hydrolysing)
MCGIAGFYNTRGQGKEVLRTMLESLVHRGPDAEGAWFDPSGRCILGHRRLSIIDTSDAGRQPMTSSDGRWVISFNGEIYNFRELSTVVSAAGMPPRGRTDTEVLANAIALWGTEAIDKLDGMFAFAAFDTLSGRLILARDAFGEKPLYYTELPGGGLAFASELQALELLPSFRGEVSVDSVAELLMFQYIGAPRTIYQHVRKLPPGYCLVVDLGGPPRLERHFRFAPGEKGFTVRPINDLVDELEALLVKSIQRRLISDVPLGAFLSGGVDSSTVCAIVRRKLERPLQTFSIGFARSAESEHDTARRFARHIGTEHFDRVLTPSVSAFLTKFGQSVDEPNGDSSCLPTYLLSEFARQRVTVAVSGDGGDELFAGYGRYFATIDENASLQGGRWRPGSAYYSDKILVFTEPLIRELIGDIPEASAAHLERLRTEVDRADVPLICRLRRTDVENYLPGAVLPKVDRMSMRHSLEVRTPFLNIELARFAERLPPEMLYNNGKGKILLRELACRYLPRELIHAPKKGFGLPMSRWAKRELIKAASKLLESDDSRLRSALGADAIAAFMRKQRSTDGFAIYQVWGLAAFESWLRHHPASLSDLSQQVAEARRRYRGPRLRTLRLAPDLFASFAADERVEKGKLSDVERKELTGVLSRLFLQNMDISHRWQIEDKESLEEFDLPSWRQLSVPDELAAIRSRLTGAWLLLPDAEAARNLDYFELSRFRGFGVKTLAFLDPYRYDRPLVQVELRNLSGWRRWHSALKLLPHIVGRITLARRLRSYARKRLLGPRDNMHVSQLMPNLPALNDVELAGRFMLFEGLRQLPPIPASHADIAARGRGRYSVWSQRCAFSATHRSRLFTKPYWVVERTAATDQYLEFVPASSARTPVNISTFCGALRRLVRSRDALNGFSVPLSPGDKIVLVTHALPPGGAERQWCYLAQALKSKGFRVSFVVFSELRGEAAHYLPLLKAADIEAIELGSSSLRETLRHLPSGATANEILSVDSNPVGVTLGLMTSMIASLKPKAVFTQLDIGNLIGGVAALLAGVPKTVFSFRNYNPSCFPYLNIAWFHPVYQELCRSSRVLLTGNSRAGNRDYAQWLAIPEERIACIPNAIDPGEFVAQTEEEKLRLRKEFGFEHHTPIVLGVFRLSEEKRPFVFIELCTRLIHAFPDTRALIVGVGPLAGALMERIRGAGMANKITLLGRRTDVVNIMQISSLLLLTSSHEGMPNVVMEAQAVGLPVVATNVGGVPDCCVHEQTALLADVEDIDRMFGYCSKLLTDKTLALEMGLRASALMRDSYSKRAMADRFVAVLNADLDDRSDRRDATQFG